MNSLFDNVAILFERIKHKKLHNSLPQNYKQSHLLPIKISQHTDSYGYPYYKLHSYVLDGSIVISSEQIEKYIDLLINGETLIVIHSSIKIMRNLCGCGIIWYDVFKFKILYDYKEIQQKKKYYGMWEQPDVYSFVICSDKAYYKLENFIFDTYKHGSLTDASKHIKNIMKNIRDATNYINKNEYKIENEGDNDEYYYWVDVLRKSEIDYKREDLYDRNNVYCFYSIKHDYRDIKYTDDICGMWRV